MPKRSHNVLISVNKRQKLSVTERRKQGYAKMDGLWASDDLVLHWELDEYQHSGKNYSCEEKRISELYDQFPGKQYIVLRVNPHGYTHPAGQA